jgi:hypothetical protein
MTMEGPRSFGLASSVLDGGDTPAGNARPENFVAAQRLQARRLKGQIDGLQAQRMKFQPLEIDPLRASKQSLEHLNRTRFLDVSEEEEAAIVDGREFACDLSEAEVQQAEELRRRIAAAEELDPRELIRDFPQVPDTPPALRATPQPEPATREFEVPKRLRQDWETNRAGWWGWHLDDMMVVCVDAGSPCDALGIWPGSIVESWEPDEEGAEAPWPVGDGDTAAHKLVVTTVPPGQTVPPPAAGSWARSNFSKIRQYEDAAPPTFLETEPFPVTAQSSAAQAAQLPLQARGKTNEEERTGAARRRGARLTHPKPLASFRSTEHFIKPFDKSGTHSSYAIKNRFFREVYLDPDLRVADDPATIWANETFGFRIISVKELLTAIPYLYILDAMFRGVVGIRTSVKLDPRRPQEIAANWAHLRDVWYEHGVGKEVAILVDFHLLENPPTYVEDHMAFLTSLKKLYGPTVLLRGSLHKAAPPYCPYERRRGLRTASWITSMPQIALSREETKQRANAALVACGINVDESKDTEMQAHD